VVAPRAEDAVRRLVAILAWLLAIAVYLAVGWVPGLMLTLVALVATIRSLVRTARELAPTVRCPRGHIVPVYGLARCGACGFEGEGSLWRCGHCGARYGHTPCPRCGLSTTNPAL
jgi:hypothetical protein